MKKILSASEMKLVCGGANVSSFCADDEKLFTCTTEYAGGFVSTGVVCASTAYMARRAIYMAKTDQMQAEPGIDHVDCH